MRLALLIVILIFIVFGALFGALNAERIPVDFYFFKPEIPKGALLLSAVGLGWLLGGVVAWVAHTPRLRRELRRTERQLRDARAEPKPPIDARPDDA